MRVLLSAVLAEILLIGCLYLHWQNGTGLAVLWFLVSRSLVIMVPFTPLVSLHVYGNRQPSAADLAIGRVCPAPRPACARTVVGRRAVLARALAGHTPPSGRVATGLPLSSTGRPSSTRVPVAPGSAPLGAAIRGTTVSTSTQIHAAVVVG